MSVERIVGIDFGTSTSVIRVKRYKDGQPVDDRLSKTDVVFGNGSPMVPTLIQKTSKGTYFGYEAEIPKERRETLYQNFKINLESDDSAEKAEARELTEEFFSYLGKVYNAQSEGGFLGEHTDTERTIVSYPVKWSEDTKKFMINAAKKAGFKNVEGMDEAQAAIHAVTVQYENLLTKNKIFKYNIPCNILLVDMGAGTTDLVMCRHTPGNNAKTEILCTWPLSGDILFGGREVDEKLIEYVKGLMPEDSPMTEGIIKKVGIKEFKSWKETVVSPALQRGETVETFSKVDDIAELMELEIDPYDIDRLSFESYLADYLRKLPQLINECIDRSGLKNNDIDLVILTGGHSQWYFVEKMLKENPVINIPKIKNDPNRILKITRPQETVALGMVYKLLAVTSNDIIETDLNKDKSDSTCKNNKDDNDKPKEKDLITSNPASQQNKIVDDYYVEMKSAEKVADSDDTLQSLISVFNRLRNDISKEKNIYRKNELSAELKSIYSQIMTNENMKAYNDAKQKYNCAKNELTERAFEEMKKAKAKADSDESLQNQINEFNQLRYEIENSGAMGSNRKEGLSAKLKQVYSEIMSNENMIAYNKAKQNYDNICNGDH